MGDRNLPAWAEEIRSTYLRGESSVFLLEGNVYDRIFHGGELTPLVDFLVKDLLAKKKVICHYNPATGAKFRKKEQKVSNLEDFIGVKEPDQVLSGLEKLLRTQDDVGVIIDYAEMIAPRGDTSYLTTADRHAVVTLHRWSLDRHFENSNNVVLMVTEALPELSAKIVSNPRITTVHVPLPDEAERGALVRMLESDAEDREVERLASLSAGLKNVQIIGILAPGEDSEEDYEDRYEFIREQVGDAPNAKERTKKLARMTSGMNRSQMLKYLMSEGLEIEQSAFEKDNSRYDEVFRLLKQRKREIIEKECFGLIEFIEPDHDFSAVGGMDEVKRELMQIAHKHPRGRQKARAHGPALRGTDGHRQDLRRGGLRQVLRSDGHQAQELPKQVGGLDRRQPREDPLRGQGDRKHPCRDRRGRSRLWKRWRWR